MHKAAKRLSIVICTFNRCELLRECLISLEKQSSPASLFEVIVVDNNSNDGTHEMLLDVRKKHPDWIILHEPRTGLSHARNTGWKHASTDWILFMDDDALAAQNLVEYALWLNVNKDFDCIGGVFKGWFLYGKPKWIPEDFFDKQYYPEEITILKIPRITGCIMVLKKQLLIDFGGFNPKLGMMGHQTKYGEETELAAKAIRSGRKVAIDPDLLVYHVVSPYKMKMKWLLLSRFQMGFYNGIQKPKAFGYFGIRLLEEIFRAIWRFPGKFWKWLTVKDYYWQHMILEVFLGICNKYGKVQGSLATGIKRIRSGGAPRRKP